MKETYMITKELEADLAMLKERFNGEKIDKKDRAFFESMKVVANPVFDRLDQWEKQVLLLMENKILSIAPAQVDATVDNMRALILHSFYQDVRRRRYMEIHKSIDFIFIQVLKELSDER